jgi:hypothetical protein
VIRTIEAPEPASIPPAVPDFLRWLGGPAWIAIPGRDRTRTRAVSTLIHGNEPSGVRAVHAWLREARTPPTDVVFLVAAIEAALEPPGFAHRMLPGHADLNRCFLPPFHGATGRLAAEALDRLRAARPEALIDLHNNTGHNPPYGVGPGVTPEILALTDLFGRRFVHSELRLGALVEATHPDFPSLTIECGRAGDPTADAVALGGLTRFLAADSVFEAGRSEEIEVLGDPVRVSVRSGIRVEFAEAPRPDADFTVAGDIDRHNFETVPPGSAIGWVAPGVWPLEAMDREGRDLAAELSHATRPHPDHDDDGRDRGAVRLPLLRRSPLVSRVGVIRRGRVGVTRVGLAFENALDLGLAIVVVEHAPGRPLPVLVLPVAHRAQHEQQEHCRDQQRHGDREEEEAHVAGVQRSRRTAFAVTTREERLIAIAACRGSRIPTIASGIASAL